jgi:P4 family phage/plasmid primase-like protien
VRYLATKAIEMTEQELLGVETFKAIFDIKDEFKREQQIQLLEDRAEVLRVKNKFSKLLTAYRSTVKQKEKPSKTPSRSNEGNPDKSTLDKMLWHERNKDGEPVSVIDAKLVDYIIANYKIFVVSRMPYIYDSGVYHLDENETRMKEIIQNLIYEKLVTINVIDRIYKLILSTHSLQKNFSELNNYPRQWVNFQNCFFDPINQTTIPHDPKYLAINQIPHEYHRGAKFSGRVTEEFVKFAVPDEADREMLWQYFGYCMTADSSLQKFLIFKGQGGTGKSQLIKIIEAIIGRENISNVSLEELSENFYPALLIGKLLNSCADIPSNALESVAAIKKITGEDLIIGNKKFGSMINFHSYAKLIFSANEIPINIDEKSEALYRRMLIIKIDRKPVKKNIHLWDELKAEINYSLMKACEALERMYKIGYFIESPNSKSNVEELYMEADNIMAFVIERTKAIDGKSTKSSVLYEEYKKYCEDGDRKVVGRSGFHKSMKNKGYIKRREFDGEKYLNIVLMDESELPADNDGFVSVAGMEQVDMPFK